MRTKHDSCNPDDAEGANVRQEAALRHAVHAVNSKQGETDLPGKPLDLRSVRKFLNGRVNPFEFSAERQVTFLDLFSGGGGLSLGVHHALSQFGMNARLLCAVDIDCAALQLTSHHFKPIIEKCASVRELVDYQIDYSGSIKKFASPPLITDSQIGQFEGKVDLLVGGPPCQGHSNLNNWTRRRDPRNLLYYVMPAFAVALNVPCIIIENVKSIRNASERVVENTKGILEYYGYHVFEGFVDATQTGVPQTRVRHFLVASKHEKPEIDAFVESYRTRKFSFNDVNSNLPRVHGMLKKMEENGTLSTENKERIDHLHETGSFELANEHRPECHRNGHTYPSVYGRMRGDQPVGTITTGFGSPGRGRYIHPSERRMMTMREAARIQSFPDWYFKDIEDLKLTRNSLHKIIGDAVPSLMVVPIIAALVNSFVHQANK